MATVIDIYPTHVMCQGVRYSHAEAVKIWPWVEKYLGVKE